MFHRAVRYATNSYYRWGVIRWFIKREIKGWNNRGFLSVSERQIIGVRTTQGRNKRVFNRL